MKLIQIRRGGLKKRPATTEIVVRSPAFRDINDRKIEHKRQGGGAATQMPAEHYHSGSNPDLGFLPSDFM
jgi:hypothetical protein